MAIASLFLISLSLVLVSVDRGNAIDRNQSQPSVCQETIYPVTDIDPSNISIGEVAIESGIARTGAHDDCKRVTPLPQGTRARIVAQTTGPDRFKKIVPWYQLDYGAWIEASAMSIFTAPVPTQATIAVADVRADTAKTELVLPLSAPVPFEIQQNDRGFGITLYNTTGKISQLNLPPALTTAASPLVKTPAPTSQSLAIGSITSSPSPTSPTVQPLQWAANKFITLPNTGIATASWQAPTSDRVQINLQLRAQQQWGYQTAYRNNSLVITLRNPPQLSRNPQKPLSGLTVVVDPGHGGIDSGAVGRAYGNTYLEKTVNMQMSEYLQRALIDRGANVVMTRTTDINPSLDDRQVIINRTLPVVSISIHHDAGTPGRSSGASIYWYQPQSQNFAAFLLDYFSTQGNRPILNNRGVIWRSFALARPSNTPAVLLEVGFMTDPPEITDLARPARQQELAGVLADGIAQWVVSKAS